MKIWIDGDIFVYRIGFGFKGYDLFETVEGLESAVKDVKDAFSDHEPITVISNPAKTFRHDIAVTVPYKGNRKAPKPEHYHELRQYLHEEMGAVMSEPGYEADDHIGMNVDKKTDIIATIDKDLNMIPAKGHYNFVKKELTKIKRPAFYFWKQMLTGDVADNIKGLHLIGEKRATDMLYDIPTKEMRSVVETAYAGQFGEKWKERFDENGQLLWILRHPGKTFWDYV